MSVNRNTITLKREDISRFVVHLTRDDRKDFGDKGGGRAIDNLWNILSTKRVFAARAHCLHKNRLDQWVPTKVRKAFRVACFTEVPLSQIHLLTQRITGVGYQREPYGVVFNKRTLIDFGAQPAIYVNSYGGNEAVREGFDRIFENAGASRWRDPMWKVLPYVDAMHEGYDFTWEREWRTTEHFSFVLRDVVAIILPSEGEDDLRSEAVEAGIPCISPGWTYEMIVAELSSQQRRTRAVLRKASRSASKSE